MYLKSSKSNLKFIGQLGSDIDEDGPAVKRRRSDGDDYWQKCLICGNKKHKGDTDLHKIEIVERSDDLFEAATKKRETTYSSK